jgi:hypothetical protein
MEEDGFIAGQSADTDTVVASAGLHQCAELLSGAKNCAGVDTPEIQLHRRGRDQINGCSGARRRCTITIECRFFRPTKT